MYNHSWRTHNAYEGISSKNVGEKIFYNVKGKVVNIIENKGK